ncbi:hypothetical protein [Massilia sp. YIM B04103]|uniref:hypothetical protein n=1 Tax=Massilia sp. YIM B04103 TaxID=2963106 RepID=UPI00210C9BBC|nr:hypothetical protein [Massilia sp. YIM B04103]
MNAAPAELLQLLTFAALQPSTLPPHHRVLSAAASKSCYGTFRFEGVCSAPFDPAPQPHHVIKFKEKTAPPDRIQARRLSDNGVVLCISVRICIPFFSSIFALTTHSKKSACKFKYFQVRKVHENLVDAQPEQLIFTFFFSLS